MLAPPNMSLQMTTNRHILQWNVCNTYAVKNVWKSVYVVHGYINAQRQLELCLVLSILMYADLRHQLLHYRYSSQCFLEPSISWEPSHHSYSYFNDSSLCHKCLQPVQNLPLLSLHLCICAFYSRYTQQCTLGICRCILCVLIPYTHWSILCSIRIIYRRCISCV